MIYLIIKSYLTILLSVGFGALFVLLLGLYLIFRPSPRLTAKAEAKPAADLAPKRENRSVLSTAAADESAADVTSIAGEDVYATQLDLAKAYIETGKINLAKKILVSVQAQGGAIQQQEAQQLLSTI